MRRRCGRSWDCRTRCTSRRGPSGTRGSSLRRKSRSLSRSTASCATASRPPRTSRRTGPRNSRSPARRCGPTSRGARSARASTSPDAWSTSSWVSGRSPAKQPLVANSGVARLAVLFYHFGEFIPVAQAGERRERHRADHQATKDEYYRQSDERVCSQGGEQRDQHSRAWYGAAEEVEAVLARREPGQTPGAAQEEGKA